MLVFGTGSQLTEVDDSTWFFEVWLICVWFNWIEMLIQLTVTKS